MKWTKEELHELNQMLDEKIGRLFQNSAYFWKGMDSCPKDKKKDKLCISFLEQSVKEYDLLMTIRDKVNKE